MLEQAFWRSIQEEPDDDAPRLIYADWLEEQGGAARLARAELIRVQCELERLPADAPRHAELKAREAALWAKHRKEWLAPLKPFASRIAFRRGFPDEVLVQGKVFLAHAETVLSAAPVFNLRLRNSKEQIEAIGASPVLRRLSSLSLYWNQIGMNRARVFLASPNLVNLTTLDLDDNSIRLDGLRALTAADMPRLRHLNLRANVLGDEGAAILAASPFLSRVRKLGLAYNGIGDAGAAALAASPHLRALTLLDVRHNRLTDAGRAGLLGRFGEGVCVFASASSRVLWDRADRDGPAAR